VRSRTTAAFRQALDSLPSDVRGQVKRAYLLFRSDPQHPSLRFKRVHPTRPIYSVRVSLHYRAVGVLESGEVIWFWIGAHDEYERIIGRR
jgi:hypothetical protein